MVSNSNNQLESVCLDLFTEYFNICRVKLNNIILVTNILVIDTQWDRGWFLDLRKKRTKVQVSSNKSIFKMFTQGWACGI